ncbi:MAG: hypothetical protein QXF01_02415 [Candidatus Micrarchaeaceae archaeon]
MRPMVIDTSSLIFAVSNGKDPIEAVREMPQGYEPVVSEGIIRELETIKERHGKYSRYAGAALLIIRSQKVRIIRSSLRGSLPNVDSWILSEAAGKGYSVCTNDMKLKRSLKAAGIQAFSITRAGLMR